MLTHAAAAVLIPPAEVWEPIQALRRRYDRNLHRWMPHITLLYPFRPHDEFAALVPLLRAACALVGPLDLELTGADSFPQAGGRRVLWLAPEPAGAVQALHAALLAALPDCDATARHPGGFKPHLTFGQADSPDEGERILEELRRDWQPLRFRVSEVALIWRGESPGEPFRVGETVTL
ncbi:MAG TPA: 2'-5' RNA ligase family protein [Roseiflexaceae bacterium]|nr:2'-5' RNA ligase family protein [Roseiflexaceae bacterium]